MLNLKRLPLIFAAGLLLAWLAVACRPTATPTAPPTPTALPTPVVAVTHAPNPTVVAQAYLKAWQQEDYPTMYRLLTKVSRDAISLHDFQAYYEDIAETAALQKVDFHLRSTLLKPRSAQIAYTVTLHSAVVGDITRDTVMHLSLDHGIWGIQWDESLILPELHGGRRLRLDLWVPPRGSIYDRGQNIIATETEAVAIGLLAPQVSEDQTDDLFSLLWRVTGISPHQLRAAYESPPPGGYIPVAEVSADVADKYLDRLRQFNGVVLRRYTGRWYYGGGVSPHGVGYVSAIQPDEVSEYRRRGYRLDQRIGRMGLERWGESHLAGHNGGTLYVVTPKGDIVQALGKATPKPADTLYTTIDRNLQLQAQQAIQGFVGAIVVLERDTGRVLALVSSPGFDPNAFETANFNSGALLQQLNNPAKPLLNRATHGLYPPGSIFKIITMAAALESGRFKEKTIYNCGHEFKEIPGLTLYDWTYDHGFPPSGPLNLPEGLMRSCNPYFWHIGLDLYQNDKPNAVAQMARAFGLGSPTGIEIGDEAGQITDPVNVREAVQQAIGQGTTLVTPLQVADYVAAVGNGGTLYVPQMVESLVDADGKVLQAFKPKVRGHLPVSPEHLGVIRKGMRLVVNNPRGTAYWRFLNFAIPLYGKTGTASTAAGQPHAWFVAYTDAQREDKPDIAVAVVVDYGGEGSEVAAPILRRVVEIYFYGKPHALYPWEERIGVRKTPTPTPEGTETPTPQP